MDSSFYQSLKLQFLQHVSLSKDAIHIYIGMAVFLIAIILLNKRRIDWRCLIPVIVVAVFMEVMDLYDDLKSLGYPRWGASVHDIVNTILWPSVLTFLDKFIKKYRG